MHTDILTRRQSLAKRHGKPDEARRVALGIRFIAHRRRMRSMSWDWSKNFLQIGRNPGDAWIHTHICHDNECPLALGFSDIRAFANAQGNVTEASVLRHIPIALWRMRAMGFELSANTFDTVEIQALHEEWKAQMWNALYMTHEHPRRHVHRSYERMVRPTFMHTKRIGAILKELLA